jgi:hypothetical protein
MSNGSLNQFSTQFQVSTTIVFVGNLSMGNTAQVLFDF